MTRDPAIRSSGITHWIRIGRKVRGLTTILGYAALVLLALVHLTPLTQWWARALAGDWTDSPGDTLIVLSSEMEADGVLGPTSYLRALYAIRAYREKPFRTIIVTGGFTGAATTPLGDALRDFMTAYGIPRNAILAENRATSTRENALFVKPMLQGLNGTTVLMTSDFHMFRARRVFENAGIHVVPRPIPDVLKRSKWVMNRWTSMWTLVLETGKIGYYAWNRWL
jgi:uncharacterized SAM-binding protein YcdF (DUF218 family)